MSASPAEQCVAVIVGSSFSESPPSDLSLSPVDLSTQWGPVRLYQVAERADSTRAYLIFRHGLPHQHLPHQVPYRAYADALRQLRCGALLTTSSVGVLDDTTPLNEPLLVTDLLMPDNRLPSGEVCTMFTSPRGEVGADPLQGHLVWGEQGVCSQALAEQVSAMCEREGAPLRAEVTFAYVPGPRTKTPAENRLWASWGAQVNSMSVGPELVLASELEIPTLALVVGHKRSRPRQAGASKAIEREEHRKRDALARSLILARGALERVTRRFLLEATPVESHHTIYRFKEAEKGDGADDTR